MVAVRQKLGNAGSLSKSKRAKEVGKRVLSYKGHFQAIFCADKERPFTAEWYESRRNIKKALSFYRELLVNTKLFDQLSQEYAKSPERRQNSGLRVHMRVAKILESLGKWVNTSKQIGHISGIEVGDEFHWRGELSTVGLHHDFQRGIDCMKLINGKIMATSIVDSGRYENVVGITSDKLVYCGEGENPNIGRCKKPKDQKLVRGNLALKNSMDDKMPVRVIRRRFNNNIDCGYKFVYDGLYRVTEFWKERGEFGTYVYKFLLRKYQGGSLNLTWEMVLLAVSVSLKEQVKVLLKLALENGHAYHRIERKSKAQMRSYRRILFSQEASCILFNSTRK